VPGLPSSVKDALLDDQIGRWLSVGARVHACAEMRDIYSDATIYQR
jgi:hypothetical protein